MPDRSGGGRRSESRHAQRYPRTARVNEVLREIVAEALEEVSDLDERLELVTVTGIETETDLRRATVYFTARHEDAEEALMEQRVRLQSEIGRQARLKRTPQLVFKRDPGVEAGWKIEDILTGLRDADESDGHEQG
jgi:ribosome-binding factor A